MLSLLFYINGDRGLGVASGFLSEGFADITIISMIDAKADDKITKFCQKHKLNHIRTQDPNTDPLLTNLKPDLAVIAGFSQRLSGTLLRLPRLTTLNLHAGKLPQYRGGSPLNWQLINDEKLAWCSVIEASERFDEGPVLMEQSIELNDQKTIADLHDEANSVFRDLTLKVAKEIAQGNIKRREQIHKDAVYWHQRNDSDGRIIWESMTARQVFNFVRALTKPYPGAFSYLDGELVRIWEVQLVKKAFKGSAGRIVNIQGEGPLVICADKALKIVSYSSDSDITLKSGSRFK